MLQTLHIDLDHAEVVHLPNFFKSVSYTFYITIKLEIVTTLTTIIEQYMKHTNQEETPPKLSNDVGTTYNTKTMATTKQTCL
jgi:hypothetical protein